MFLGRVVGNLVATEKHQALKGRKLLWVERIAPNGEGLGRRTLAVDSVGAGVGDSVLIVDEGNGAAQILKGGRGPIRTVIAGIVDSVCLDES